MINLPFRFHYCLFHQSCRRCLPNARSSLLMSRLRKVQDNAGNIGHCTYHARSFASTVPRLHHSFSVLTPTVVILCKNVATYNASTDNISNVFIYMYLIAYVCIDMFMSIGLGHFHLICSKCDLTNFYI